jgi:hypothetical protein
LSHGILDAKQVTVENNGDKNNIIFDITELTGSYERQNASEHKREK